MTTSGLPPIDPAMLPKDVRTGSAQHRQAYEAALGFERMLVEQLTQTLADTATPSDDQSSDPATTSYQQMLPGTLADAITADGGLGLARQIVPAPTQDVKVTKV